jgi:hypothetical protein
MSRCRCVSVESSRSGVDAGSESNCPDKKGSEEKKNVYRRFSTSDDTLDVKKVKREDDGRAYLW